MQSLGFVQALVGPQEARRALVQWLDCKRAEPRCQSAGQAGLWPTAPRYARLTCPWLAVAPVQERQTLEEAEGLLKKLGFKGSLFTGAPQPQAGEDAQE